MTERVDEDVRAVAAALLVHQVHVRLRPAEGDDAAAEAGEVPLEQRLAGRDHGRAAVELLDELGLGGGHVLDGADQLEVHRRDGGDHAHVGQGHARQLADLPRAAHGHLDDHDLGAGSISSSVSGTPTSLLWLASWPRCGPPDAAAP